MDGFTVAGHRVAESELDEVFTTSGGPGGQHANRNQTAVTLRFQVANSSLPDDLKSRIFARLGETVETVASESRSQWRNRVSARRRMAEKLEAALVDLMPRRPTKPTRSSRQRRLAEKRARSETKRNRRRPEPE